MCSDEISYFFNSRLYLPYQTVSSFGDLRLLTLHLISQILVNPDSFLRHAWPVMNDFFTALKVQSL